MRLEKKIFSALILCFFFSTNVLSQTNSTPKSELSSTSSEFKFIRTGKMPTALVAGTNLAPISVGEYSVQVESYRTRRFGFNLAAGIAPNPTKGTLLRIDRIGFSDIGKGHFVRAGADYQFIKNNGDKKFKRLPLEPFIGVRIIYSRIKEEKIQGNQSALSSIILFENYTSNNIGAAISAGTAINFSKIISLKAGIQIGTDVISNRLYSYGYTPGMGLDWGGIKTQLMATLRVRVAKGERVTDMTRRN